MFHASCHAATSPLLQSGTSQPIIPSVMLRGCGVCFHGCRVRVWGAARRPLPLPAQCPVPSAHPRPPVPGSQVPQSPVPSAHRLAPTTQRPGPPRLGLGLAVVCPPRVSPCNSHTLLILNDARESLPVLAQLPPARTQKPNKRTCGSAPTPSPSIIDPTSTAVAIRTVTVTDIAASPRGREVDTALIYVPSTTAMAG